MPKLAKKSKEDVEHLKQNWFNDPCYDLEDAEGFEPYKQELYIFRLETELDWQKKRYIQLRRATSDFVVAFNNLKDILKK